MGARVSIKITDEQNEYLEKEAQDNGMNKSEYIKARLFEDSVNDSKIKLQALSEFEKDLISCAKKAVNFAYLAAKKLASEEELYEATKGAENLLLGKGYKNQSK